MSLLKQALQNDVTLEPAGLTAPVDDYSPTGFEFADTVRLTSDAAYNITGFSAANVTDSLFKARKIVINANASFALTLKHSVTSTAAYQLLCPGAADLVLAAGEAAILYYDETTAKWRVYATAGSGGSGETNTVANLGGGTGWYQTKVGSELRFKSAVAGYGIAITTNGSTENTLASDIAVSALVDGTVAIDADAGPNFELLLEEASTLSNPTNSAEGKSLVIVVKQDATGGRTLAFGANFVNAGSKHQVDLAANAVSVIVAHARDFGSVLWYYTIHNSASSYQLTPATITATQTAYAPAGFSEADTIRLASDASRDINGFLSTAVQKRKLLVNVGSNNIVIKHQESGTETAANRVICPGGADITLAADDALSLEYDITSARWRAV